MSGFPPPPPPPLGGEAPSTQFASPYAPSRPGLQSQASPSGHAPHPAPGSGSSVPAAPPSSVGGDPKLHLSTAHSRPDDDRARSINTAAFPGPYSSPQPTSTKRDAHLAAAEKGAAAYRADGRLASLGQPGPAYHDPSAASPYHLEAAWNTAAADKERESQEKKDARAEREKIKRTQIEVLNRPALAPPAAEVKTEPLGLHQLPPQHQIHHQPHVPLHPPQPPPPTSSMRGGPSSSSSRKAARPHSNGLTPSSSFGPGTPGSRSEFDPAALASAPNPLVRTPFLPSTLAKQAPFLGRFVYGGSHWMFPSDVSRKATELSEASAAGQPNGPGGKIEVVIPAGYLGFGWALKSSSEAADPVPASDASTDGNEGWKALLATVNHERRVWGTEVYTDDSDLVGVLVHSGWLVPAREPESSSAADVANGDGKRKRWAPAGGAGLRVELRVVGRLLRFIGTDKHGVKSRGWGNGHDGASITVENVALIEKQRPPTLSRRTKRPRIAQILQMRNELVDEVSQETISLNVFGGAGYKYSPDALVEAMELSEIEPPEEAPEADAAAAIEGKGGQEVKEPEYKKLRPDLQDSDLLLENAEERYRIRLDNPTTSHLSIRIFPKYDPPSASSADADNDDEGEPLGCGLMRQRDLEWVEGGLIVRDSPLSDAAGVARHQSPGGQRGWFCKVVRWWWERRPADSSAPTKGASTIPGWVAQPAGVAAAPAVDPSDEGDKPKAVESAADVSMQG